MFSNGFVALTHCLITSSTSDIVFFLTISEEANDRLRENWSSSFHFFLVFLIGKSLLIGCTDSIYSCLIASFQASHEIRIKR